jgi:hypothetical protein
MGLISGFLGFLVVLALVALLATGIVAFRRGILTFATVVHTYTAFVLGVCTVLALWGGALLLKSLASVVIARDFSYQTADFPRPVPPPGVAPIAPQEPTGAARAATEAGDDLTAGITLLVIGGGLGAIHAFAKAIAARRDVIYGGVVARGLDVALLAVGAGVGLASGTMLLNDLLRRYVVTAAPPTAYTERHPGGALGLVVMFVPLWVYYARRVWRTLGASPVGTIAPR